MVHGIRGIAFPNQSTRGTVNLRADGTAYGVEVRDGLFAQSIEFRRRSASGIVNVRADLLCDVGGINDVGGVAECPSLCDCYDGRAGSDFGPVKSVIRPRENIPTRVHL